MGRQARPWYREANGWWYATIDGRQAKLAEGRTNRKAAERRFHELKAEAGKAPPPTDTGVTLGALADAHYDAIERAGAAADTRANYKRFVGGFLAHAGKAAGAEGIRPIDVATWLDSEPGWGPSTRRLAISCVKAVFRWGRKQGLLETDPLAGMERPPPRARAMAMDRETFRKVAAGVSKRGKCLEDFLLFMHETGCRPSEAMRLEAGHLDLGRDVAEMPSKTSRRTGKPRKIHLTPKAKAICEQQAKVHPTGPLFRNAHGRPWTRDALASRFYRLREKLGLPRGTCAETIRHGFATDAAIAGVPPLTIAALMGHSDLAMLTGVYSKVHERDEHLREGLGKVRPGE
jgi:integrase/recombinase XerC